MRFSCMTRSSRATACSTPTARRAICCCRGRQWPASSRERGRVISAKTVPIDWPAGGEATVPFQVRLPLDGASGPQRLRLEFEMPAEPPLHFTIYREVQVGLGDVELTARAHLDEHGNLVV